MIGDDEDKIYKLTFFATNKSIDKQRLIDAGFEDWEYVMPTFIYPDEFHSIEKARIVAKFWMSFGFFDSCRCDCTTNNLEFTIMNEEDAAEIAKLKERLK